MFLSNRRTARVGLPKASAMFWECRPSVQPAPLTGDSATRRNSWLLIQIRSGVSARRRSGISRKAFSTRTPGDEGYNKLLDQLRRPGGGWDVHTMDYTEEQ